MTILYPGMLFTASICWLIFFFGLFVAYSTWQAGKKDKANIAFALFWLLFAFVYFFVGARHFFAALGFVHLDITVYIIGQIFIFLHMVPAGFYIYSKIFKKQIIAFSFTAFFSLLAVMAITALFKQGIIIGPVSDFTTEYAPNAVSLNIFRVMLVFGMPLFYYHILRFIFTWLKKQEITQLAPFLASLSVVVYASLGYFDEKGYMMDWPLVFLRLSYLFVLFLAYLSLALREPSSYK